MQADRHTETLIAILRNHPRAT